MRNAREYVNPGDLVVVHGKYNLTAGICKQWTDVSFQYFLIKDYKHSYPYSSINSPQDVKNEVENRSWVTWTNYIRSRVGQRVVKIEEDYLNDYQKAFYEVLKDRLDL